MSIFQQQKKSQRNRKKIEKQKGTGRYGLYKGKKKKKTTTETVPEKDLMADLLIKHFKTTVLKMLKELKEDV